MTTTVRVSDPVTVADGAIADGAIFNNSHNSK